MGKMEGVAMENGKEENEKEEPDEDSRQSTKEREKMGRFLEEFTEETSIHGVKNAFHPSKSRIFRGIWIVLGLSAICSLLRMLYELFCSYKLYKVQTVVMVTPSDRLPFPAVTICNLNGMEMSKLQSQDSGDMNVSSAIVTLSVLSSLFGNHVNASIEALEKHFPPELLNRTFQDISTSAFADLNTTLISCFWDGQEERCEDMFQPLDLELKRCFQFNGQPREQQQQQRRRVSHTSGLTTGLQVLVNIRQDQYLYNEVVAAGAQVILHEPGEMPDITSKGFLVAPGSSVTCRTSRKKYNYLPKPFKAYGTEHCVNDVEITSSIRKKANVTKYTNALCRRMCIDALAQSKCGCRFADVSFVYDPFLPLCTVKDVYTCYIKAFANESRSSRSAECPCPRQCQHTEYEVTISSAYFPSEVALDILQGLDLLKEDQVRKNIFNLQIFYDDLVSYEVSHVPQYTVENILGTIGGQMGLFIGASLLSLAEVGYLLLTVVVRSVRAVWRKITPQSAVQEKRVRNLQQTFQSQATVGPPARGALHCRSEHHLLKPLLTTEKSQSQSQTETPPGVMSTTV